jgi:hypothetical protein
VPARRRAAQALAAATAVVVAVSAVDVALAAFGATAASDGNVVGAAPDFMPPEVTAAAVGKASGGASGFVKPGGAYYVYADVTADTGSPASGIVAVAADVAELTAGAGAVPLTAGSYSAGGVTYGYRSGLLTADALLAEGERGFVVTATDGAANSDVASGSATVDGTAPLAADVQTANAGINGRAEQGDTVTLSFSEPVEPGSIKAGWAGAAANVVVRLLDNGLLGLPLGNDALQIYDAGNVTQLPLGVVDLGRGDYVGGLLGGSVRFGASGTPSSMTMAGSSVTVTLGTYNATIVVDPARTTAGGSGTLTWTPVATPYDRAQNPLATTPAGESGAADRDF